MTTGTMPRPWDTRRRLVRDRRTLRLAGAHLATLAIVAAFFTLAWLLITLGTGLLSQAW